MSENLAIKTDNPGDWEKKKDRAVKDLKPRPSDSGLKSSWAHCDAPLSEITRQIITDPQRATCELQALAMFILDQRLPTAPRRNKILGVSIRRAAIREDLVREDSNPHPIESYAPTHRSLMLENEDDRRQVLANLFSRDEFKSWKYSREMLADLLEELLDGGYIAAAFKRDAESLLREWRA